MNKGFVALFGGLRLARPERVTDALFEELELERKRKREQEEEEEGEGEERRDDAEEEGEEGEPPLEDQYVKLVVLDFDGTMTMTIVPRTGKRPPLQDVTSDKVDLFKRMTKQNHIDNFGGQAAVDQWKALLQELIDHDIEVRILSYGKKEAIVHALEEVGLADYFTTFDAELGNLVWGRDTPPLLDDDQAHKPYVLGTWMDDFGGSQLWAGEVIFVDDDPYNIDAPERGDDNFGVAPILAGGHARLHQTGFYEDTIQWIRDLCGLTAADQ